MMQNKEKLERILSQDLGLTPYESKAYIALIYYGPMSPSDLNQRAGIPRPRTYDVLSSLVGKGLLIEQPGRPPLYAVMEPKQGLTNLLLEIERDALALLEEKRKIVRTVVESLSPFYKRETGIVAEKERVWVTRKDSALIARYTQAIRSIEREMVVFSSDPRPPEKEILEAVKDVLKKKKTIRVIRQATEQWTPEEIEHYEKILKLGSQVRYLEEINVRYSIFDKKAIVFWLTEKRFPAEVVTVWITNPPLAEVMYEHFENHWLQSQPIMPILDKLKKAKTVENVKE